MADEHSPISRMLPGIYRLSIPFHKNPLRGIYNYLICGKPRNLLIDTAFNNDTYAEALNRILDELGIELENTDIFITHMHVDHCGLISELKRPENRIYASHADRTYIDGFQKPAHWSWLMANNRWCGTPQEHSLQVEEHVAFDNRPSALVDIEELSCGDSLCYGDYSLEVVDLAGHTPGHIGLFHEETASLFCGDHILGKISPNITTWDLQNDYVDIYCSNLKRVAALGVRNLFPAHGKHVEDVSARIEELLAHHARRIGHIKDVLSELKRPATAFEVASRMKWGVSGSYFDLPKIQKWFTCSEVLAYMQHMVATGCCHIDLQDGARYYSLIKP